jgi:two-component system, NtrC family, sensor histidine kinase PilS
MTTGRPPQPGVLEQTVSSKAALHSEESWFGAFGAEQDLDWRADEAPEEESHFVNGLRAAAAGTSDPQFLSRQATRLARSSVTAFERIYRTFVAARAALGLALAATLVVASFLGLRPTNPVALVGLTYSALTVILWLLPRFQKAQPGRKLLRLRRSQWLVTIGADIVCFLMLHMLSPGSSLNYMALLVMPMLMAGVLTSRTQALATAAGVTLVLLVMVWWSTLPVSDITLQLTQAGLAGSGFFVITVLAGELAGRLAREELTARGSLEMARQQAQLNRLVIQEMEEGVLVVDRRGRVRAANPAARSLLAPSGMSRPAPFQLRGIPAWGALVGTVERAFVEATWPEAGRDVVLHFDAALQRTLRARIRFTRERESQPQAAEELCVLFLEDLRTMQARSRQEKLAAMGRMSAGIAHEIRNPLAAISQANALLLEDVADPSQQQLMTMVRDNVERLKRIVDDVMEVAPGAVLEVGAIDANAHIAAVCAEWARSTGVALGEGSVLRIELPNEPLGVVFDAEHLRRLLVNLLDNASRYASQSPGAIFLRLDSQPVGKAFLSVASDGAPISAEVEPYLFEPFFSTRSRGTGLGLYICRELCERYGAVLNYRLRSAHEAQRNEFFVEMRRRPLSPSSALASHP